ncbi:carboxylesterase BioH (pimeloyl-CoA synthesis) [Psychromonas ingrahamii 37]|uniref:Pimeloyl-[acyl-carrier protein] methyl ester esterase n=1 Tax=Psychromonas ingrahamii (strain DSM 17664 / CCUG 51855 / 37) TaxID=357804 RepID=A1SZH2_PSYIN|nr:pimeloyl-ACP methyl ester esterase BioH [Psychromonas ingrahamii]ABM04887.1 carboxylesterase BioH (pimeloyl-CoA synthesis) [Psychromonas ingrahamii 37]
MIIEQRVYCRVLGEGPNLLLLHGWGVNSAVWDPVLYGLSAHFRVHLIDLPGFGRSEGLAEYSLDTIVERIMESVPEQSIWCGWSLGGLIASHASYLYPNKIAKLIQVCTSPKFVGDLLWPGVETIVFENFKLGLLKNSDKTLARFISIQAMGCESTRKDTLILKKLLKDTKQASLMALSEGLNLLSESDLRREFAQISLPCLSIFGQFDSLVPIETSVAMQQLLPDSLKKVFMHSSHAPFISEPEEFIDNIISFSLIKN